METLKKEQTHIQLGGWSTFNCQVDSTAQKAFDEAEKPVGLSFSPVAVSQQVVAGMNYRFFCNTKVVYPNSLNNAAIVCIYKPLNEKAVITSIIPIHL